MIARWLAVPAVLCMPVASAAASDEPVLQPYQMVRSLQLLQDQLAAGDHAALPMQRKLLELIDERLRGAEGAELAERRNFRAVLVYGMSGGNPATLSAILRKQDIAEEDRKLLKGILAYLNGSTQAAQTLLGGVEPTALPAELGAFLALVKGSVIAAGDPKAALRQFDLARLLGPGTLVEEAAIRRSLAIEASSGEARRFFRAASQYVRRFLRSPYASQFADSFVTGILQLHEQLDYAAIDEITGMMDVDQRKVIYLRIARRAAIEGLTELSAYAAGKADGSELDDSGDPRAELYAILSNLTSENVESVAAKLGSLDRQQLTESDIRLLEAAERLAAEMTASPTSETSGSFSPEVSSKDAAAEAPEAPPPAVVEPQPVSTPAAGGMVDAGASPSAGGAVTEAPAAQDDPTAAIVSETRARLDAIDKLLEDAR